MMARKLARIELLPDSLTVHVWMRGAKHPYLIHMRQNRDEKLRPRRDRLVADFSSRQVMALIGKPAINPMAPLHQTSQVSLGTILVRPFVDRLEERDVQR
jgi:hypothetical protein